MSSHVTLVRDESVAVSGEAELNSEVKGIGELLLGVRNARWSIGMSLSLRCRSDSSTARGILNRFEVGKKKQLQLKRVNISRIKPPEAYKSVECRPTTVETTAPDKIWLEKISQTIKETKQEEIPSWDEDQTRLQEARRKKNLQRFIRRYIMLKVISEPRKCVVP